MASVIRAGDGGGGMDESDQNRIVKLCSMYMGNLVTDGITTALRYALTLCAASLVDVCIYGVGMAM